MPVSLPPEGQGWIPIVTDGEVSLYVRKDSQNGRVQIRTLSGQEGSLAAEFFVRLIEGDLECPECAQDFVDGDSYSMAYTMNPFELVVFCEICDTMSEWSDELRCLVLPAAT